MAQGRAGAPKSAAAASPQDDRSPLLRDDWDYVDAIALDDFGPADWALLRRQRAPYYGAEQARQALRLLTCSAGDASFGYRINNYRHCLQTATLAQRAGEDEETVAVALLHDIGFVACPDSHGEFAAALLANYISEKNHWMLCHHAIFQQVHMAGVHDLDIDPTARERWRGHPHFQWTADFVERYDQRAMAADYDTLPVEAFVPLVERLFARPPRALPLD
jgi:predicted HD phosphohydrolase